MDNSERGLYFKWETLLSKQHFVPRTDHTQWWHVAQTLPLRSRTQLDLSMNNRCSVDLSKTFIRMILNGPTTVVKLAWYRVLLSLSAIACVHAFLRMFLGLYKYCLRLNANSCMADDQAREHSVPFVLHISFSAKSPVFASILLRLVSSWVIDITLEHLVFIFWH